MTFYVYHGYVSPDQHESNGPNDTPYKLTVCKTEREVLGLLNKQNEDVGESEECSGVVFRVIEGRERKVKAVARVTDWRLE